MERNSVRQTYVNGEILLRILVEPGNNFSRGGLPYPRLPDFRPMLTTRLLSGLNLDSIMSSSSSAKPCDQLACFYFPSTRPGQIRDDQKRTVGAEYHTFQDFVSSEHV